MSVISRSSRRTSCCNRAVSFSRWASVLTRGRVSSAERIEVRGIYRPMHLISGDMFGYQWDERQGILSGYLFDVMGHGVPAALRTSAIMVLFHQAFEDVADGAAAWAGVFNSSCRALVRATSWRC